MVNITSFNDVLINLMGISHVWGSNTEYTDAYLLLSTDDIIENEHISISKEAFLPRLSLSLHKTAK